MPPAQMKQIRFVMIGGFLGAGKTTAIARLARHYVQQNKIVGLVTNDQAYDLVDTHSLRAQGFQVGEVPGACFCCKFDDLVKTLQGLEKHESPDVLIAEPVGSCTDLFATVIQPLRQLYGDQYEVGPLAVLLKPEHGRKILCQGQGAGFSPKAEYIFLKQIEEADIVAINKTDKLTDDQRQTLVDAVKDRFADKQVLAVSARRGDNFEELVSSLQQPRSAAHKDMDVDYQLYAEGEAELGWLNCQVQVTSRDGSEFSLDELLVSCVTRIGEALAEVGAETAHLKLMGHTDADAGVANLVGSQVAPELSLASERNTASADLIVNARVATDPEQLEQIVTDSVAAIANGQRLDHTVTGMQRFRPAPPVPTHRIHSQP